MKCKICGCEIDSLPMCFGSSSPAWLMVPPEEYEKRVLENDDQCIVDGVNFFVRGHIEIPIWGTNEVFNWSVWVSLSEQSFEHMNLNWEVEGREHNEPYFGWLCTDLPFYPKTSKLRIHVHSQPVGRVPSIKIESTNHPLYKDQSNGITMEHVYEIVHCVLHEKENG